MRVANIQHLATPIHAQLSDPRSVVELAGLLHPTPAVGGEPREAALAAIAELEDMDRGWYAGPVGWMDSSEDGEMCVALRSALLRDRSAHLYAGAGIVADSDPAAELAETELKLDALLPLLAGLTYRVRARRARRAGAESRRASDAKERGRMKKRVLATLGCCALALARLRWQQAIRQLSSGVGDGRLLRQGQGDQGAPSEQPFANVQPDRRGGHQGRH